MSLFQILPNDILKLIQEHLSACIIQYIFKIHRPLTILECGNRIKIINKKIYGTIIKIYETRCKIKLLPRIIPHWKLCNIKFWKNYEYFLKDYSFPYYTPKELIISSDKLIKLNNWNEKIYIITTIDGTKRLNLNENENDTENFNENINKKSSMCQYFF
jgi:hypothetical protein